MTIFIIAIVIVILLIILSSYKRVRSNTALVIWGKGTGSEGVRIKTGGATFVIPLLNDSKAMSLQPFVVEVDLKNALSNKNIRVNIPATFTLAISKNLDMLGIAARRILDLNEEELSKQAEDIILGQLRAVIASLTIEQINGDREKFETEINKNISTEVAKLGLELINVNIKDITDEEGYIEAIGKKASSEAISNAEIDVANAKKTGTIGVNEANRDKEVQVAELEAQKVEGKNISEAKMRESDAELKIKSAQYEKDAKNAELEAQILIQKQTANAELETLRATEVSKVKANKEKIELQAEADKNKIIKEAEAEAQKIKLNAQAEAEGIKKIMQAKADGYKEIEKSVGKENLVNILLTEQLVEVTKVKSDALQNLNIDKITVWDNPSNGSEGKSGLNGFVDNFANAIPGMHEIAKDAGITLPSYLGTSIEEETIKDTKVTKPKKNN